MWTQQSMSFLDSLMVSGVGLLTVLVELVVLALLIVVFSKIFVLLKIHDAPAQPVGSAGAADEDEEACAVLMAAISEELHMDPDEFRIVSITELSPQGGV